MNHILRLLWLATLTICSIQIGLAASDNGFKEIYYVPEIYYEYPPGSQTALYGLQRKDGTRIIDPIYHAISEFSPNGLAMVYKNGYYGFINTVGQLFIPLCLRDARPFDKYGIAAFKREKKWGLVTDKNMVILKDIFDRIDPFQSNGLAIVKYDGRYGLVDTQGNIVLPIMYDKIEDFDDSGYAFTKIGNKFGVTDSHGRALVGAEHKNKKSALAALDEVKERLSKQNITFADISKNSHTSEATPTPASTEDPEEKQLAIKNRQIQEQKRILAELAQKQQQGASSADVSKPKASEKAPEQQTLADYISLNLGTWSDFMAAKKLNIPSEDAIRAMIEDEIGRWQIKGEFESTPMWQQRVNETTRSARIKALADSIFSSNSSKVEEVKAEYRSRYEALVDTYCDGMARRFEKQELVIKPYDADNQTFLISTDTFDDFLLPVPIEEAPAFKQEWDKWKSGAIATFVPNGGDVALKSVKIGKYSYDSDMDATYAQVDVDYNFKPVDIAGLNISPDAGIDTAMTTEPASNDSRNKGFQTEKVRISAGTAVDTDINIPQGTANHSNTFAVVIANSDYAHASKVAHAENDGRVMTQYLTRTLGISETNVATFINATYGQLASAMSMLQDIGDAYKGSDFNIMFYYVGHGLPDDEGKKSYILPVDIDPRNVSICMPLEKIYADLGNLGARNVTVMVDACFSGTNHGEGMLVPQSMGVALKPKKAEPVGNMVVLAATDGNETAFPYEEKSHGLFTYWLLRKLQETAGDVTFGELSDYVIDNVRKTSVTVNRKPQTPTVATSPQLTDTWRAMQFGN